MPFRSFPQKSLFRSQEMPGGTIRSSEQGYLVANIDGGARGNPGPAGYGVVIEDEKMQFLWGGNNKGAEARFLVDPAKDPKEIEVIYTVGSERYKRRIGIYKLDGDTLTLSLSEFDADKRPTKFAEAGTPGGGDMFIVYLREKDR